MDSDSGVAIIYIIVIICMVAFSAYFSATETAFSCLNRIKLKNIINKGNKKANKTLVLYDNYDKLISSILIGNNLVNIISTTISTLLFINLLGQYGSSISTIVITITILIFGEITPKAIAKEHPEKFAIFSTPFISIVVFLCKPFNYIFSKWKNFLSKQFKNEEYDTEIEQELLTIVEEATENGSLKTQEKDLIQNAIAFGQLEVGDIYIPRIDVVTLSIDTPIKDIEKIFIETAFSRIPVYKDNIDNIVGILNSKDFFANKDKPIDKLLQDVMFTTKTKNIHNLLLDFQKSKIQIAVIIDEYGGMVGIVTMEDILEELVGEIWDEHDEIIIDIEKYNNKYRVLGKCNISDLEEELNLKIKSTSNTVGGWCCEMLSSIPKRNDKFIYQNYKFIIDKMDDKRIDKVLIIKQK